MENREKLIEPESVLKRFDSYGCYPIFGHLKNLNGIDIYIIPVNDSINGSYYPLIRKELSIGSDQRLSPVVYLDYNSGDGTRENPLEFLNSDNKGNPLLEENIRNLRAIATITGQAFYFKYTDNLYCIRRFIGERGYVSSTFFHESINVFQ